MERKPTKAPSAQPPQIPQKCREKFSSEAVRDSRMAHDPRIGEFNSPMRELHQPAVHKILFLRILLFSPLLLLSYILPPPVQKQQNQLYSLPSCIFFKRVLEAADATVERIPPSHTVPERTFFPSPHIHTHSHHRNAAVRWSRGGCPPL